MDAGTVVPRAASSAVPDVFKSVQFRRTAENELEAYIPALASGVASVLMPGLAPNALGEWDVERFGNWNGSGYGTPLARDGKDDIRKGLRWWRRNPLVYKCVKALAQISNSRFTIECEDDDFREIVEMWVQRAMPHSFRKAWFVEYFRSSMVPTIKTLIPYKPRDYKKDKLPQTTEDGQVTGTTRARSGGRELVATPRHARSWSGTPGPRRSSSRPLPAIRPPWQCTGRASARMRGWRSSSRRWRPCSTNGSKARSPAITASSIP